MTNIIKWFAVVIFLGLNVSAYSAENIPAVDARYETTKCAKPCEHAVQANWWMMRTPTTVEVRHFDQKTNQLAKQGEMWKYSPNGKSGYLYLMHDEKRAIEYLFDDLRILGLSVDEQQWQINTQFLTDKELAGFRKDSKASETYQGYTTEVYQGKLGQADVNVTWIPALKIPVKLEYDYPKNNITIQLKNLAAGDGLQQSKAPKTAPGVLAKYDQVYYTDIGDMEEDPTAQEWIAKASGAPGMHAHHH